MDTITPPYPMDLCNNINDLKWYTAAKEQECIMLRSQLGLQAEVNESGRKVVDMVMRYKNGMDDAAVTISLLTTHVKQLEDEMTMKSEEKESTCSLGECLRYQAKETRGHFKTLTQSYVITDKYGINRLHAPGAFTALMNEISTLNMHKAQLLQDVIDRDHALEDAGPLQEIHPFFKDVPPSKRLRRSTRLNAAEQSIDIIDDAGMADQGPE